MNERLYYFYFAKIYFVIILVQIASSGVELSRISELYTADIADDEAEKSRVKSQSLAKKRKVESAQQMEFEMELKVLNEWFASTESTLQLLVANNPQEPFTVEEQRVLIQVCIYKINCITCLL